MPINMKRTIAYIALFLLQTIAVKTMAQTVYESHHSEVYQYLNRMAQKGLVVFDDQIRPLSRTYIASRLDSLVQQSSRLSAIEQKELAFYRQEFRDGQDTSAAIAQLGTKLFRKDPYGRWRSMVVHSKDASLYVDPVLSAATIQGDGKNIKRTSSGVRFWGRAGKHFAYQFSFNDVNESGSGFDTTRALTPETGIIRKDTTVFRSQNYTEFRGSISYSWKNGSVSFGQDHLLWGYGENGRIVLSDKAPAYPQLRFDYQPFKWMRFNYAHAWLNSKIVDSNRSYSTGTGVFAGERLIYIPKYFATHSIQLRPIKGLDISLGESIVYSDRFDVGYLVPLMFFKVYDNIANNAAIQAGSNGQLFFQASSRNHIKNTHLYGTLFIDEIRIGTLFDKVKRRNQLGYTLGASVTDCFVPYLTAGVEYTRVNPFVYRNLIPAQDYSNHQYSLGDWMGNNFDRWIFSLRHTPLPRLKCQLRYQVIRKGGAGTLAEQYFLQPQPPFLFQQQPTRKELLINASYEWINGLRFTGWYSSWNDAGKSWSLGVAYGL